MLNALTIDVEDYFQVHAFSHIIRYEDWGSFESRVESNTHRVLEILATPSSLVTRHSSLFTPVKATFFCLGWIAERYPQLIKEIQGQGHEIACHGYAHRLIYKQSKKEFKEDIHKAKAILEDIISGEVLGYRAPSYSITNKSKWAFEVLVEEGFKYDSSIFPIQHDFYGIPDAPRFFFLVSLTDNGNPEFSPLLYTKNSEQQTLNIEPTSLNHIFEFPLSTIRLGRLNVPVSGGGYFRLLPYPIIKLGLKRLNEVERRPFVFYLHPWELDPDQPRIQEASLKSRFRHYLNLSKTESRLNRLLYDFRFAPIKNIIEL
jgi:polysaccharide deacetylase family protein (PEP-CTERM system associated)